MKYKSLAKLFYADASSDRFSRNEATARERLESDSTFRTGYLTEYGELFLSVPRELSILNEQVMRQEQRVASLHAMLPPVALSALIRGLVIDEVVCTNELEGVRSTHRQIDELLEATPSPTANVATKRFRELARLYLELSDSRHIYPKTPEDVRAIYDRIMSGEDLGDNAPDGELFRKGEVEVIGTGQKVIHAGLHPEQKIISAIGQMLAIAGSTAIPQTYSALLAHFIFEYIHPFYDGNGRTGRYLLALYLSGPLSTITALSLSRSIAENRAPYYRAFKDAELPINHGELTPFVLTMLEYVSEAQKRIIEELEHGQALLASAAQELEGLRERENLSDRERDLLFLLLQHSVFGAFPDVPTATLSEEMGLGVQMTRRHLKRLEGEGLVERTSARPVRFSLGDRARKLLLTEE